MLVLAGAGSGKTRVITERISRLIQLGVPPRKIMAVSFTNKAAAEMSERMIPLVGRNAADKLWLSTFHRFGVRFLQRENRALGYDGKFVIFDQGDALAMVRDIVRAEGFTDRNLDMMAVLTRISLWKNAFLMPEQVPENDFEYDVIARGVYPRYQEALAGMHAFDFDDLVVAPVRILRDREDIREKWRARFSYLMIDEFQDTNKAQLELVRLLANELHNVCVVGDDDQSIYGWRGAEVGNILDFERYFKGAKVVKLEENYRSYAPILEIANAVIKQSSGKRHDKTLRAARGPGAKVKMVSSVNAEAEAKMVAKEIRAICSGGVVQPRDIAVLYRSNTQARAVEEELRMHGIPYRVFGGTQFFDRKEIKDAVAYLRLLVHPRDTLSLRRVVNYPPRGIGDKSLKKISAFATLKGIPLMEALRRNREIDIPQNAQRGAQGFVAALDTARESFESGASIYKTTEQLMRDVDYLALLRDDKTKPGERRRENFRFFMKSVNRYDKGEHASGAVVTDKPSLAQFLTRISLRFDNNEEEEAGNRVTLSSLHSSKGLEFDHVFLIGCVEGILPHSRTTDPKVTEAAPTDIDEERRLFYVGVTRARDQLYISRPERRESRGRVVALVPSRFLEGLPDEAWEEFVPKVEAAIDGDELANMAEQLLAQLRDS